MNKLSGIINKLRNGAGVKLIIALGLAGMLIIMLSEIFSDNQKKSKTDETPEISAESGVYDNYAEQMEIQLKRILERIDGVGKSEIMVTVGATEEYVYAQEGKTQTGEKNTSEESQYVIIGSGGGKQALLKKIVSPEISGVVIICEGGDSSIVKERVYNAVSAVFNIPLQRIFVTKSSD